MRIFNLSKKDFRYYRRLVTHLIVAVLGWAIFNLLHSSLKSSLEKIGIISVSGQYTVIIVGAVGLLLLLGYSGKKISDSI